MFLMLHNFWEMVIFNLTKWIQMLHNKYLEIERKKHVFNVAQYLGDGNFQLNKMDLNVAQ